LADAAENPAPLPDEAGAPGVEPAAEPPSRQSAGGLDDARLDLRSVGYCAYCDALVERQADGSCAEGHPREAVAGRILLLDDEPVPQLPRFNWAAFFLPPVWGPAYGQWVGALFLPIWLFADSAVMTAVRTRAPVAWIGAAVVLLGTIGFEYFFARRANGIAFRQVMDTMTLTEFVRRQRLWALFCVPIGIGLIALGIYYDVAIAPLVHR
jgi:hypothetical protein